jgi:hypothetical protein
MEEGRTVHRVLVGNLMEEDHRGYPDVNGKIILRLIFWNLEGNGEWM